MRFRDPVIAAVCSASPALALALFAFAEPSAADRPAIPPDFVILLADDLGWGDVGYHGSEIRTPQIDRLAREGVRLERFYAQPTCAPTRSSLMTGRYPFRYASAGPGTPDGPAWRGLAGEVLRSHRGLPPNERTLAEALREVGYQTAVVGKWHLGSQRSRQPLARGFDHHHGSYAGAIDHFTHQAGEVDHFGRPARRPKSRLDWYRDGELLEEEGYSTDLIARAAVRIIESRDPGRPLFLYVAFHAPHFPLQAPDPYIESYSQIEDGERRIYAAMVTCLDDAVGRIVAALEARRAGRALILFASDNGAGYGGSNGPLRGGKETYYEGGVRVPAIALWPGTLEGGRVVDELLHIVDWYPTLLGLAGGTVSQPRRLDGMDVWPTLAAGRPSPRIEIPHSIYAGHGAIRRRNWKLLETGAESAELYDLGVDPGESKDLAGERPDKVKKLKRRLAAYRGDPPAPTPKPTPTAEATPGQ